MLVGEPPTKEKKKKITGGTETENNPFQTQNMKNGEENLTSNTKNGADSKSRISSKATKIAAVAAGTATAKGNKGRRIPDTEGGSQTYKRTFTLLKSNLQRKSMM